MLNESNVTCAKMMANLNPAKTINRKCKKHTQKHKSISIEINCIKKDIIHIEPHNETNV